MSKRKRNILTSEPKKTLWQVKMREESAPIVVYKAFEHAELKINT